MADLTTKRNGSGFEQLPFIGGMSIMGVDANYQKVVKGLVLLAAVIFDVVSKRKQN